jgi:hypothetical protein
LLNKAFGRHTDAFLIKIGTSLSEASSGAEVKGTKMKLLQGLKELASRHLARQEQPPGPVDAIVRLLRDNDSTINRPAPGSLRVQMAQPK